MLLSRLSIDIMSGVKKTKTNGYIFVLTIVNTTYIIIAERIYTCDTLI